MCPPRMFQELRSGPVARKDTRSRDSCPRSCSNTLSSMDFTLRRHPVAEPATRRNDARQAGCMAKSEQKQTPLVTPKPRSGESGRLPSQIDRALKAADAKKAVDLVVLDLRK